MHDQRLTTRLQNYWNLIRRGKDMPEIAQLNPQNIDDLWQRCVKLEVIREQGNTHFKYQFMGERLIQLFGRDLTHSTLDTRVRHYPHSIMGDRLSAVLRTKEFAADEGKFVNANGKMVKYRACLLPFGTDERGVTHIIVGFSDREF